jgi:hypothetical protein
MAVIIEKVSYIDKFRTSSLNVDWLLANIGEPIDIHIDFRVEQYALALNGTVDAGSYIYLNAPDFIANIVNPNGLIYADDPLIFENFYVNDTVNIIGSTVPANDGAATIIEKISPQAIRVNKTFTSDVMVQGGIIYVTTPFKGVRYFNNFIENDAADTYASLTTGEVQLLTTDVANTASSTPINMVFKGLKDYQIGSATIEGLGASAYGQRFRIKHSTVVTPLFLEAQYDDLIARVKPDYFEATKCLKHIFRLECNRDLSNPNDNQIVEYSERSGNSGWFNENYNGGATNYSIENVQIQRVSGAVSLTALELTAACDITFRIKNTVNSPFSASNTKAMATFWQLPEQQNYVNNGRNLQQNYVYDYSLNTEGSSATAGAFNVAINEFALTRIDNSNLDVRIRTNIDITSQGYIDQNTFKRYLVGLVIENHALTRETSDKVHLLINTDDFYIQLFDTNLITNNTLLIEHPRDVTMVNGVATVDAFPTDDLVAYSEFSIDFDGLENDGINILRATHQLVFKKSGFVDIVVENIPLTTTATSFLNGYVPIIDVEQNREFRLADNDSRKLIQVKRDDTNDSGTIFAYIDIYPFMVRWEYWEALTGVSNPPSGVFNTSLPNNGLNHFWHRFSTLGYELNYRLRFTVLQNGEQFTQTFDTPISTLDFNSNPDWTNESIKSYDLANNEIVSGGNRFLQGYEDTLLVASFTDNASKNYSVDDIEIKFLGIVKEAGNIRSVVRYSSVYTNNGTTFFKSVDGSGLVIKEKDVNLYKGKVLVDFTKLPSADEFTIYARLYEPPSTTPFGKQTEDGDFKTTEDNIIKTLE